MRTLGEKIKQLRSKLTQEELAAILKVERSTLASWEVNRREPDIATLCRIADYFRVSIDWLVGRTLEQETASGSRFCETTGDYHAPAVDKAWHEVIATAQAYGFDPDSVQQLLRLNAKIAAALQANKLK
ncbi:helix-turn-helix domain-containing protein [Sporomusa sphaeroides]|uniref:helix-turn-helix domain-containing protein n=1 Tax=Sporomusa sphaeroides TaxID=47679 RepID=UPI002CB3EE9A|nr:helix-turn-helix transcriptional regulator [Sporomusa sphaeroides]HML32919.1 helix-turn-helix transcriptional regulator [Sporomusa sphaeroides]